MSGARRLLDLWRAVEQAGGRGVYIERQLTERGFLVERRETDSMSKAELARYKKALKEEAAERKRLKKDAWLAYRESHIVHLGEGVYWSDKTQPDRFDLDSAEARAAEFDLPKLDTPKDLAAALELPITQLRWLAFHRDAARSVHYRRFTIQKRDGSERPIWAPLPKLKRVQRWILREIVERLPVHGAAHGFVPGRSILTNARRHTGSQVILKTDLKGFFPTVTFPRVKGVFRNAGYREQVATLLALLCTEAPREVVEHDGETWFIALGPRSLPQGAPTSPALTNTLCQRLDRRQDGLAGKLGWRYTRYADDLTFSFPAEASGPQRLGPLMAGLRRIVEAEGFELHPDKTRVARQGSRQKVTGLIVNGPGQPRVPRKLRRELRAALHHLEQGQPLREGENLASLSGYAAFVFMADPDEGRRLLEELGQFGRDVAGSS